MADTHGGYRKPENPAAASGPGALSQRTDGGAVDAGTVPSGGAYGERQELQGLQSGADMSQTRPSLPGLTDPTARPDEPITAGADAGAGIGMQAAGIQTDAQVTDEQLRPLLRSLELMANLPGSNPETRTFVRNLKARLSNG